MNILLVNLSRKWWGGNETYVWNLTEGLILLGHRVNVVCCRNSMLADKLRRHNLPYAKLWLYTSGDVSALAGLIFLIKQFKTQIIHGNWGKEFWPVTLAGRMARVKVVLTRHLIEPVKPVTRFLINHWVDKLIVPSQAVYQSMKKSGIRVDKLQLVYNGVNTDLYHPGISAVDFYQRYAIPLNVPLIGILSNIPYPQGKGHFLIIKSIPEISRQFPQCRWLIMGDGPLRTEVERTAEKLGVRNKMIFTGRIPTELVPAALSVLDIYLTLIHDQEACSLSLLEAMSAGKAIIASRIGGNVELIEHQQSGYLISPDDLPSLIKYCLEILYSEQIKSNLGNTARHRALSLFSDKMMVDKTLQVYSELVSGK